MGKRLTKIYTRTGDKGTTGLGDGTRVDKDAARVETFGTVDELNCAIGMVLAEELPDAVRGCLSRVQNELFDLGGELCIPSRSAIDETYVARLEADLDQFNSELPSLKEFILPGGGRAGSACHLARAICRRAERRAVSLNRSEALNTHTIVYLNRLSDLLFVVSRLINRSQGQAEIMWRSDRMRSH